MHFKNLCSQLKKSLIKPWKVLSRKLKGLRSIGQQNRQQPAAVETQIKSNNGTSCDSLFEEIATVHSLQEEEIALEQNKQIICSLDLSGFFEAVSAFKAEFMRLVCLCDAEESEPFVSVVFPPLTPSKINIVAKVSAWELPSSKSSESLGDDDCSTPSNDDDTQEELDRIIRPFIPFRFLSLGEPIVPLWSTQHMATRHQHYAMTA